MTKIVPPPRSQCIGLNFGRQVVEKPNVPHSLLIHLAFHAARYVDHEGSKAEIQAELLNVIKEELHHVQGVPGWQLVFKEETLYNILNRERWMTYVLDFIIKQYNHQQ